MDSNMQPKIISENPSDFLFDMVLQLLAGKGLPRCLNFKVYTEHFNGSFSLCVRGHICCFSQGRATPKLHSATHSLPVQTCATPAQVPKQAQFSPHGKLSG